MSINIYIYITNYYSQTTWPKWMVRIGCEGLCFHVMRKHGASVRGWPPIGCGGFHAILNIPNPLLSTLVFR